MAGKVLTFVGGVLPADIAQVLIDRGYTIVCKPAQTQATAPNSANKMRNTISPVAQHKVHSPSGRLLAGIELSNHDENG